MNHQLTVTVIDALGIPGRARGVECRCTCILIKVLEVIIFVTTVQELLIVSYDVDWHIGSISVVREKDEFWFPLYTIDDLLKQGYEIGVNENYIVLGVIDGIQDLFRR